MSRMHVLAKAILAIAVLGATTPACAADRDLSLRAELERITKWRILIGHQSVGMNLLDGVKQLAMAEGVPVHIVEVTTAAAVQPATIGHTFVAANGNPLQKLESFGQAMGLSTEIDVALVKLCYVDFKPETDATALFKRYQATIDGLKAKNPGTTFVHVTAPLTTVPGGAKANLKRFLGRAPYGIVENMRRAEYNALLRQAYLGREPIFDLARIESTTQSGSAVTAEWKDNVVPVMDSAYTDDGGHLNEAGKTRAARELIAVLAAIPVRPTTDGMHH